MKKIFSIMIVAIMIISLVGCSAESNKASDNGYNSVVGEMAGANGIFGDVQYDEVESESSYSNKEPEINEDYENTDVTEEYLERKIVYTVTTELQTKDFDAAMTAINDNIQKNGGYVQSQKQTDNGNIYNSKYAYRTVRMVVRVPSENLETFLSGLQNDNMYTLSLSKDSKDYSTTYYDKEIRINNLKIQEERLLDMLSKATDLKTMLELEDRLTDVRYEIESLTKEMNIIDANVDYSTVTITMEEVVKYDEVTEEPKTFMERIYEAFKESWNDFANGTQDFAVSFVYAIPTLIILGLIALCIFLVIKTQLKRRKPRQATASVESKTIEDKTDSSKEEGTKK